MPEGIIRIINKFVAIFCIDLFNRYQFRSFTFLRVHALHLLENLNYHDLTFGEDSA